MEVSTQKPAIEVTRWVRFNTPDAKEKMLELMKSSSSKTSFATKVKDKFNLSMNDALFVANQFYKE